MTKKDLIKAIKKLGGVVEDEKTTNELLEKQLTKLERAKAKAEKEAEVEVTEVEEESPKFVIGSLGYLGGMAISSIQEKVVDNRKYNNVELINGVGYLLSDKDLKKQVKKEA